MKHTTVEKFFNETNKIIHLKCEVECGYPSTFTYTWFDLDGNVLSTSTDDTFEYKVTANETIDIYCHVSNTLNYTDLTFINESRTYFKIQQESSKLSLLSQYYYLNNLKRLQSYLTFDVI